jgi:hypothetical protein
VDRAANHQSLPVERGSTLSGPRPGRDLRYCSHPPAARHGDSRQADCARVAMAERVRGAADRHDPAGMRRPPDHVRGGTPAPDRSRVCRLLQWVTYPSRSEPGCPVHRPVQSIGAITSRPVLGGLHHQYCRTAVARAPAALGDRPAAGRPWSVAASASTESPRAWDAESRR